MTNVYMLDRGDDASEFLQEWVKKERDILNRDITKIKAGKSLLESLKNIEFEPGDQYIYVPTLWEGLEKNGAFSKTDVAQIKAQVHAAYGTNLMFFFPLERLQLIDVVTAKRDHKLNNGDCAHAEIAEEQCGICLDCIEKFLCYKLAEIDTEEAFMECPFTGHESKTRLYEIMGKVSGNTFGTINRPSRQEISIANLLVRNFLEDNLPADVARVLETNHQVLLTESV